MDINSLTPMQMEAIDIMFFGPYIIEWRDSKGQVDNKDITIAKRLGLSVPVVNLYLTKAIEKRTKKREPIREESDEQNDIILIFESRMNYE